MRGIKTILVLAAICELVSTTIVSTPANVAILRGNSTELICRANSGSKVSSWTFTDYQGSIKDVSIYGRAMGMFSNVTTFRSIKDEDGFLNIRTDSVQPQDAGLYTCIIELQKGKGIQLEKRSAHLIVLDSDPSCTAINYSTNGRKYTQLSCNVGFRGNWSPVMEWRKGDSLNATIITTGIQNNTSSNFVSYSLTIPVVNGEEATVSYTCVTFFSAYTGNVIATATNIPNYIYIWPPDLLPMTKTQPSIAGDFTEALSPSEYPNPRKSGLIELTVAVAAVIGVLLLLLMIISARNYRKYSSSEVQSDGHEIHNEVKAEANECSRNQEKDNFKSESCSSTLACRREALNQVVNDKSSCSYFATDGTEYMDINSGQSHRPQMPIRHPSRYEQVIYASIDHTLKAPLLPRYV